MPDTFTSRLNLLKAAGTSLIKVQQQIDDAFDIVDSAVGVWDCTAATHPTTNLFNGKLIREVDTGNVLRYDLPNLTWQCISGPLCFVSHTPLGAVLPAAPSTWAVVAMPTEYIDTQNMHDAAVNNSRITVSQTGYYEVKGKVVGSSTATYGSRIYVNGAAIGISESYGSMNTGSFAYSYSETISYVNAGAYFELWANATIASATLYATTSLTVKFLRP